VSWEGGTQAGPATVCLAEAEDWHDFLCLMLLSYQKKINPQVHNEVFCLPGPWGLELRLRPGDGTTGWKTAAV